MPDHTDKTFLGRGWAHPISAAADGGMSTVEHDEDIRQSIRIILATGRGERVMRPDFGAGLPDFQFEPLNQTTMALVRHRVEEALVLWEPRIDSIRVQVSAEPRNGRLDIEVRYRVRRTNTFYNLVYPFFLLEGETS